MYHLPPGGGGKGGRWDGEFWESYGFQEELERDQLLPTVIK